MENNQFTMTNIVKMLPSSMYYPYRSNWVDFLSDFGKVSDSILSDNISFLSSTHKPDHQNLNGLRLELQDLGFDWDKIHLINQSKLIPLINYLKSYRNVASQGSVVAFPSSFINQSGYQSINTLKLVSFLSNTTLKIIPLWSRDGTNLYSIEQAYIISGLANSSGKIETKDTIYSTSDIDPTITKLPTGNEWYLTPLVDIVFTPMSGAFSVQDTVDLFNYLMPITVKIRNVEAYEKDHSGTVIHTTYPF